VHKLAQSVLGYVRKQDLIRPGDRVGVAVSGGADSVGLLRILLELRSELGIVLSVVHLNHTLRGAESDADEQFVRELAKAHELRFFCESRDVKAWATEGKLSIETAARGLRYKFFEKLLQAGEFNRLATAHTLDDQAETVLLKLLRGTGTRGLAGIYPLVSLGEATTGAVATHEGAQRSQPGSKAIVRPLLGNPRADLEHFLADVNQAWREDSSNLELRHTRNRIRHEVLPLLQKYVNPSVHQTLSETAEIARAEEEFWSVEAGRWLATVWTGSEGSGTLQCDELNQLSLALRRRLVRVAARSLGLNLEFGHVEEVLSLSEDGARAALPSGWTAHRQKRTIRFELCKKATVDYEYRLIVPGKVAVVEAGICVATSVTRGDRDQRYNPDDFLDMRFAGNGLAVKNWRAGDRFWPSHSKGPKKIKELLQDRHVTGAEKKRWPVIVSGDEVVWLRGFGVGRGFQSNRDEGILIREEPLDKEP
jgi:tRNA(Ile)-lysidine synthase